MLKQGVPFKTSEVVAAIALTQYLEICERKMNCRVVIIMMAYKQNKSSLYSLDITGEVVFE
jgi:hypothetical protein